MILSPLQDVKYLRTITEAMREQTIIDCVADAGVFEVQKVVCPTFAAAAQGDYFVLTDKSGTKFAVWLDKDGDGTAPSGAAYVAADKKLKASIVTGDDASAVATAVKDALDNEATFTKFTISKSTSNLTFTSTLLGDVTAPARHNTGDTGNGTFVVSTVTAGVASSLQNKYFAINSPTVAYYVWLNLNGEGVDPAVGAKTAIAATMVGGATKSQVASAVATALENHAAFEAIADTTNGIAYATTAVIGASTDAVDGDTGFTITVGNQGEANIFSPSMNVTSLTDTPSLIVGLS